MEGRCLIMLDLLQCQQCKYSPVAQGRPVYRSVPPGEDQDQERNHLDQPPLQLLVDSAPSQVAPEHWIKGRFLSGTRLLIFLCRMAGRLSW